MAFIPFDDGAMAIIEWGSDATQWTTTLWFKQLVSTASDYQELADFIHDHFGTNLAPELWDNFYLRKVTVYDMQTSMGSVTVDGKTAVQGGVTGTGAALNAALVVTFRTASRGRSARGRNYVTGLVEADMGANEVTNSTRITNITDAYEDFIDDVQTNTDFYWVVASHYSEGVARAAVLPIQISAVEVRSAKFGSQRRRIDRP